MYNEEIELTRDEVSALAALPREIDPGVLLEARVIRALRAEGHLGGTEHRVSRRTALGWKVAAAATLFAGGVATGRYMLVSRAPAASSMRAPVTDTRDAQPIAPRSDTRTVQRTQTSVAEREIWL